MLVITHKYLYYTAMQLLTLNTWAGLQHEKLFPFIAAHATDTDIFTFQEIFKADVGKAGHENPYPYLLPKLQELLPNHTAFYSPAHSTNGRQSWGNATFVRNSIAVNAHGDIFDDHELYIDTKYGYVPYAGLWVRCTINVTSVVVYNQHGLWAKDTDKKDIPPRLEQAKRICDFLKQQNAAIIMAGDFNLVPDSESIHTYEQVLRNLNTTYHITDTRSTLYTKPIREADYIFTNDRIADQSCATINTPVSDHLPIALTFSLK